MRLGIGADQESKGSNRNISQWVSLPYLCCQAAGGHLEWADDLAVAWILFYSAAHLMDKVQDQDEPDAWWRDLGPGVALSAATGLYFSASLALNRIADHPDTSSCAVDIAEDFHRSFLIMTSGQYRDLGGPPNDLEEYWERASAKSGSFFALACHAGARLATDDAHRLEGFQRFGTQLGLLIQIKDDLDDIQPLPGSTIAGQRRELANSLTSIYTLSLLPEVQRQRLNGMLRIAPTDANAAQEALQMINSSGATLYVLSEIERHLNLAINALEQAALTGPAKDKLEQLANTLAIPRL